MWTGGESQAMQTARESSQPKFRQGFTLLEMVIALGVAGLMTAGVWQAIGVSDRATQSNSIATHALAVGVAAQNYLAANRATVLTLVPALDSLARIKVVTSDASGSTPSLQAAGNLPASFVNLTPYGQTYQFYVLRQDAGVLGVADSNDRLVGFVITTGGEPIDDRIGATVLSKLGAAGGFMFGSDNPASPTAATTVRGVAGSWGLNLTTGNWPTAVGSAATAGHLVVNTAWLPSGGDAGLGNSQNIDQLSDGKTDYTTLYNVALGSGSGNAVTTGQYNTVTGSSAMALTTQGSANTAYGESALYGNTTGSRNSAFGRYALYNSTTVSDTTSMGYQSLRSPSGLTGTANTGVGAYSLYNVTTGQYNTAVGYQSMSTNLTGNYNTAFGYLAMGNSGLGTTSSSYNTAIGPQALYTPVGSNNTAIGGSTIITSSLAHTACDNVGIGMYSFSGLTTGCGNVGLGLYVGNQTSTGQNNTAIGALSLWHNTTGSNNIAIGYGAYNPWGTTTTGSDLVAVGYYAGFRCDAETAVVAIGDYAGGAVSCSSMMTAVGASALLQWGSSVSNQSSTAVGYTAFAASGTENTGVGAYAGRGNGGTADGAGNYNVALGTRALRYARSATYNVALGYSALYTSGTSVDSGASNVAVGASSLYSLTTGLENVAVGFETMRNTTTSSNVTAIGYRAHYLNSTGVGRNTAFGQEALYSTTGVYNVGFGYRALYQNGSATSCTAVGALALSSNTTGAANVAVGSNALLNSTTNSGSLAIGYNALLSTNASGGGVTGVGYQSLMNSTGATSTGVGASTEVSTYTNATAIGYAVTASAANSVRFGNASITTISGQVAWSFPSDRRDKHDIHDTDLGLDFIMKLRPVRYRLNDGNGRIDYGFIAQEVEQALAGRKTNMIRVQDDARHSYLFRSNDLLSPVVKGVQEQQETLDELSGEIARLRQRLETVLPVQDRGAH